MSDDIYLDALLRVPRLGSTKVSPDGNWIAWTWSGIDATADVYVAAVDATAEPIQLTTTVEHTVIRSWTPDSTGVIVAQDHGGDERVQLFRVDLEAPGMLRPLTDGSPDYFLRGGELHPDKRWLVYAANIDFDAERQIEESWVYRHDLVTDERRPLARPRKASYTVPELSEDGCHLLYTRSDLHPAGIQVWLVDIEGRNDRELLNVGDRAKVTASWFPDGRRVLFLAETGKYRRLGVLDIDSGQQRWLIDDSSRSLESAFVPRGGTGDTAVVVEVRSARSRASLLDVLTGEEQTVSAAAGDVIPLSATSNGLWLGHMTAARQPADIVRFSPRTPVPADATSVTQLWGRTRLTSGDLSSAEDVRWESVDGLPVQGWLYRPTGTARGTIVQVHGGPTAHSEDDFQPKIQYLVHQGFNVLCPNYRGSTGFGLEFEEAIKEDGWGGREQDDIRTGIEMLIARGVAEPGRVGITGTSYGGYSSWWAITHWPTELVAAAAPICGMTDLVVDYYTTRPDLRPYSADMMGGSPEQVPQRYRERSPIHFVKHIQGSLLIVQGLRDPNVTPDNVDVVLAVLDQAEIEYRLLMFEDEGHGIAKRENLRTLYQTLSSFFADAFARVGSGS